MENEILVLDEKSIREKIYIIRGKEVMIDSDLAGIYGYTTKAFNQQVKKNIDKFDEDFMFQLTEVEYENLRSKKLTSRFKNSYGGRRYLPYAFTEQGIYMLMTVLKGEKATKESKALIRIFKKMKDYIIENNTNLVSYDDILKLSLQTNENTKDIKEIRKEMKLINDKFNSNNRFKEILILNGKRVESDNIYREIYSLAKKSIYIIDDYINLKTLVLLKDIDRRVKVTIFSDNVNNKLHKLEYEDFIKDYPYIDITFKVTNNIIHDRYIVLDFGKKSEKIFHCGCSSKDSGSRITSINEINDREVYNSIIDNLLNNDELVLK